MIEFISRLPLVVRLVLLAVSLVPLMALADKRRFQKIGAAKQQAALNDETTTLSRAIDD